MPETKYPASDVEMLLRPVIIYTMKQRRTNILDLTYLGSPVLRLRSEVFSEHLRLFIISLFTDLTLALSHDLF